MKGFHCQVCGAKYPEGWDFSQITDIAALKAIQVPTSESRALRDEDGSGGSSVSSPGASNCQAKAASLPTIQETQAAGEQTRLGDRQSGDAAGIDQYMAPKAQRAQVAHEGPAAEPASKGCVERAKELIAEIIKSHPGAPSAGGFASFFRTLTYRIAQEIALHKIDYATKESGLGGAQTVTSAETFLRELLDLCHGHHDPERAQVPAWKVYGIAMDALRALRAPAAVDVERKVWRDAAEMVSLWRHQTGVTPDDLIAEMMKRGSAARPDLQQTDKNGPSEK